MAKSYLKRTKITTNRSKANVTESFKARATWLNSKLNSKKRNFDTSRHIKSIRFLC